MALIERVLQQDCFAGAPPVLVDIGASGALPAHWQRLAPYSIGVAFDADSRDFEVAEVEGSGWKKRYSLNRLVGPAATPDAAFYLARSAHCSSSLRPHEVALRAWAFAPLFEVVNVVRLPAVTLQSVLRDLGLSRIDWFKCDSQGTDLRIFRSLDSGLTDRILVADFEPGIIDAYEGEDKLHHVMAYMEQRPFWISDMDVKGSQRIDAEALARLNVLQRRSPASFLKRSPGWCEISYVNTCDSATLTLRDCLLAWVFASIKGQHGFAIRLATLGRERFGSELFPELLDDSRAELSRWRAYGRLALAACRRLLQAPAR